MNFGWYNYEPLNFETPAYWQNYKTLNSEISAHWQSNKHWTLEHWSWNSM